MSTRRAKEIVDSLVYGARDLNNFPELSQDILTQRVLQELISRVRPLTLQVGQLECKIKHIYERMDERCQIEQ
jgi:hypothetical protein